MNREGAAGLAGYDAQDVVRFLDEHRVTVVRGGRRRKSINGFVVSANQARVIRRWRNTANKCRRDTVIKFIADFGLTRSDFERYLTSD